MGVQIYDPKDIVLMVGGVGISGYADGTFIKLEYDEDLYGKHVSGDGVNTTRIRMRNRSGKLTVTLDAASNSNAYLSALKKLDDADNGGVAVISITDTNAVAVPAPISMGFVDAKNLKNDGMYVNCHGWVSKMPSVDFGKDLSDREWQFDLVSTSGEDIDLFVFGSLTQAPLGT